MSITIWALAGGLLGWAAYSYLKFNEERGVAISVLIGAVGGVIGGKLVAPMFLAAAPAAAGFSSPTLFFAAAAAAACLFAGNLIQNRWGI